MKSVITRIRKSEFLRNVFTLVSATSLAQGLALAIYPVLSRIYTPAEHGLFALYMSIIAVTAILSTGKYELAVMIPKNEKDGAGLSLLGIIISGFFSLVLMVVVFIFKEKLPGWLGNSGIEKWLFFIPISTFLIAVFQSLSYWNNRNKNYRRIAGANLGQSLLNSAVKLSTSKLSGNGGGLILGAIGGQLLGAIVFAKDALGNSFSVFRQVTIRDLKRLAREYIFFPKYNLPHYVINNFSSSLPVFVLSSWFSPEQVGFYSFGFMMVNRPMNLLTSSFTQVFSQRVIENFQNGRFVGKDVRKLVYRLMGIAILPFTLAAIFGPSVFSFVFGKNWGEAGIYMRILLPWLFMVFLSSPLSFLPDMLSRQKKAMWIDIIKFGLRITALAIGVIMNDIYLALIIFSGISFTMVSYSLFWYVNLSRNADILTRNKKPAQENN